MNQKLLYIFFLLLPSFAQAQSDTLLLQQVIEQTLSNNPNIKVNELNISVAKGDLQAAEGTFNTQLSAYVGRSYTITPNTLDLREGLFGLNQQNDFESRLLNYRMGITRKLNTGTEISTGAELSNFGKDNLYDKLLQAGRGQLITNQSGVYLNVSQPLLQGLGKEFNTANIRANQANLEASQSDCIYQASVNVLDAMVAYTNYISAYQNLFIQQETENAYLKVVSDLTRLVELDQLPRAELLFIQANASLQSNNRIYAQNNLAYSRNLLGALMGLSNEAVASMAVAPASYPIENINFPDSSYLDTWIAQSTSERTDYASLEKDIEAQEIRTEFSRQTLKPKLDLSLGVGYSGIFEGNGADQFVQPFIKNIPGMNYSVGLTFDFAPKRDFERGVLAADRALLDQAKLEQQALTLDIHLNIKRYYNQLQYFNQVVESSRQAVNYNKTALKNEFTKLKLGTSTVINVVQVQNNYVISLNALNRALQDLNTAFLFFRFHTGTLVQIEDNTLRIDYQNFLKLPQINN